MRKQLDPRIPILINNNVKKNHRSFIVLVGDKGRDQACVHCAASLFLPNHSQVVNLHFLLSQARVSARPSVLWCYKKDLGFTTYAISLCQLPATEMFHFLVTGRNVRPKLRGR